MSSQSTIDQTSQPTQLFQKASEFIASLLHCFIASLLIKYFIFEVRSEKWEVGS
jgi:hypothetical protein